MWQVTLLREGPRTETGPMQRTRLKRTPGMPGGSETILANGAGDAVRKALDRCGFGNAERLTDAERGLLSLEAGQAARLIRSVLEGKRN